MGSGEVFVAGPDPQGQGKSRLCPAASDLQFNLGFLAWLHRSFGGNPEMAAPSLAGLKPTCTSGTGGEKVAFHYVHGNGIEDRGPCVEHRNCAPSSRAFAGAQIGQQGAPVFDEDCAGQWQFPEGEFPSGVEATRLHQEAVFSRLQVHD